MKCAICQPTYIPYPGFFELMKQADVFVFLDNVQFSKQSWQQRNQVEKGKWLTVPVKNSGLIKDIEIDGEQWIPKHLFKIGQIRGIDREFDDLYVNATNLCDLNIKIILWAKDKLGIKTKCIRASELPEFDGQVERLIGICKHLGCDTYISPIGSKEYIDKNNIFEENGITLKYFEGQPDLSIVTKI